MSDEKQKSAHSQSPWTYAVEQGARTIRAADGESLMGDTSYYPWAPSNEADWPLIAAAPESHAANVAFVNAATAAFNLKNANDDYIYDEMGSALSAAFFLARAAVAKATGAA